MVSKAAFSAFLVNVQPALVQGLSCRPRPFCRKLLDCAVGNWLPLHAHHGAQLLSRTAGTEWNGYARQEPEKKKKKTLHLLLTATIYYSLELTWHRSLGSRSQVHLELAVAVASRTRRMTSIGSDEPSFCAGVRCHPHPSVKYLYKSQANHRHLPTRDPAPPAPPAGSARKRSARQSTARSADRPPQLAVSFAKTRGHRPA